MARLARGAGASGEGALDAAREVLDERRLYVNASGTHSLYDFGEKTLADNVTKLTFAEDCAGFSRVSLDMLCYGMTSLVSVTGLGFLHGLENTVEMFERCTALAEVDFSGAKTSGWTTASMMLKEVVRRWCAWC